MRRRTATSGAVFFDRTCAIVRLRCWGVRLSIIAIWDKTCRNLDQQRCISFDILYPPVVGAKQFGKLARESIGRELGKFGSNRDRDANPLGKPVGLGRSGLTFPNGQNGPAQTPKLASLFRVWAGPSSASRNAHPSSSSGP